MEASIKQAKISDADRLVKLGKKAFYESPVYRKHEIDEPKIRQILVKAIYSKRHYVGIVQKGDVAQGFLIGIVDEMPFSSQKRASDWAFYVLPKFRGYSPYLVRNFLTWAWDQKGVVMVGLSNSAGIHIEKTEALYAKMGLSRIGGIWLDRYIQNE